MPAQWSRRLGARRVTDGQVTSSLCALQGQRGPASQWAPGTPVTLPPPPAPACGPAEGSGLGLRGLAILDRLGLCQAALRASV